MSYTMVRYYVNSIDIEDNYLLYFFNKGLAFTALFSMSISYIIGNLNKLRINISSKYLEMIKYFGVFGFITVSIHIILSLMLLSPAKFPYLYIDNLQFNFYGEMTILFGVVSIGLFMMPAVTSIPAVKNAMIVGSWKRYQQMGYLGLSAVVFHVFFVEIININLSSSWTNIIIPISYIAWFLILTALILKIVSFIKGIGKADNS